MRRIWWLAAVVLLYSSALFAQTSAPAAPPQLEPVPEMQRASMDEVRGLFDAIGSRQQIDQMMKMMQTQLSKAMEEQLRQQTPPPSPRQVEHAQEFMKQAMNSVNVEELLNEMAQLYQKYLTRDEIVAIRAFYTSPAGKSMIAKIPGIMAEYMQVALPRQMKKMQAAAVEMQERIRKDAEADASAGKKN
jgi:hypothetical protein